MPARDRNWCDDLNVQDQQRAIRSASENVHRIKQFEHNDWLFWRRSKSAFRIPMKMHQNRMTESNKGKKQTASIRIHTNSLNRRSDNLLHLLLSPKCVCSHHCLDVVRPFLLWFSVFRNSRRTTSSFVRLWWTFFARFYSIIYEIIYIDTKMKWQHIQNQQ